MCSAAPENLMSAHLTRAFLSFHGSKTSAGFDVVGTYGLKGQQGLPEGHPLWALDQFHGLSCPDDLQRTPAEYRNLLGIIIERGF